MTGAPQDDAARLNFYERFADAELFLALEEEPEDDDITPMVFPVDGENLVLVFDREDRLDAFLGQPGAYAAISGRALVPLLTAQGLGAMLNPEVAPSQTLIPLEALNWLERTLGHAPREMEATPQEILPPGELPEKIVASLDTKLAGAAGLARYAYLVTARYEGGGRNTLLGFVDPLPGAEAALARAVQEALVFAGLEAAALDVAFFRASDPVSAALARHGLRFDLPEPEVASAPGTPGKDPNNPPRLV